MKLVTNFEGVTYWEVYGTETVDGLPVLGRVFITYHPEIPYEAFCYKGQTASKRTMTPEEGERFILSRVEELASLEATGSLKTGLDDLPDSRRP